MFWPAVFGNWHDNKPILLHEQIPVSVVQSKKLIKGRRLPEEIQFLNTSDVIV
jgi:hypothetical protein